MFEFIVQNLSTIIVGIIVLGIFAAVVVKLIKDHKNHKTSCGCGCDGCPSSDICHHN